MTVFVMGNGKADPCDRSSARHTTSVLLHHSDTMKRDGYTAVQLGAGSQAKV